MTKINMHLSEELFTELKIMAILTKKTMSAFIRIAIQDKIKELKKKDYK